MTTFQIDLQFKKMETAETILNTLYAETSTALDKYNLVDGFCNCYLPISKKVTVFAECKIDAITADVRYFVVSSKNTAATIQPLDYTNALRQLRGLLGQGEYDV